jgi:hypothetical protein
MARKHALLVSLLLGVAIAAGGLAAVRTAHLGQASTTTTGKTQQAQLLKRERLLKRQEIALRHALAKRPPTLPKVPKFKPPPPAPVVAAVAAAPVRTAPTVVVTQGSHGDDEEEHESEGHDD